MKRVRVAAPPAAYAVARDGVAVVKVRALEAAAVVAEEEGRARREVAARARGIEERNMVSCGIVSTEWNGNARMDWP